MLRGFKQLILRGSAVDLAVGLVGTAFGTVVTAFAKDLLMRCALAISVVLALGFLGHPVLAQDATENSGKATRTDALTTSRPGMSRAAISGVASGRLAASTPPLAPPPQRYEETTAKAEGFLGYSYIRANPGDPIQGVNLHGGSGSIAFNANDWFGIVADLGGYKLSNLRVTGFPSVSADSTVFTYLFGPRLSYRRHDRVTPFVQALFGGAHQGDVTAGGSTLASSQNAFAMTAGGGLDVKANRHIAIRLIQAEYLLTRFKDPSSITGRRATQNNARISTGIVFRFGTRKAIPNASPVASCSAAKPSVYAESGEDVAVHVSASDPDNDPLTYSWSATGGRIDGTGTDVRWNSAGLTPGSYTVSVRVDDGRSGTATCAADIKVEPRPNRPPTATLTVDRSPIPRGERSGITCNGSDPDNDPLTYSYTASGGRIVGSGTKVEFDSAGLPPGSYTVKCTVDDGRGGTAVASSTVEVQEPPQAKQLEVRLALHSIYFPTAQPTVANPNGGLLASQAETLNTLAADFKQYLTYKPDSHLILEGHADIRGSQSYNQALSDRRVARTKSYLAEKGVPADHIETKAFGAQKNMTDAEVKKLVDEDPNLTPADKKKILANLPTVTLANSRRVDVTLSTTGEQSVRRFPFNAKDALTLISRKGGESVKVKTPAGKKNPKK